MVAPKTSKQLIRYYQHDGVGSGWHIGYLISTEVDDSGHRVYTVQPIPLSRHRLRVPEEDVEILEGKGL